ncbi:MULTISPECIES: CaiB/BaiF CoA transferase family protein [Rhodococcus]|uniref:CoA transferase n=1 Tax=Rhodococcus rhodochrous TaxID=1829 RepID=A0AAW4XKI8_RHORH|nr:MULTISPECIES: CaiB/BaiF CoA-transferase family protein [Rhodococcus]MCD2113493.1 CoA transferase [Rhodococcus rhodochrous]QHG81648.1 CoA transferase [Rhodococcus rhodochrous]QOH58676.1 carnitine dehydratase [Rhodococcus rhodochrous]WAL46345.1 CaiB/BaiF CoA-transferase family protein [Rhodococcus pyridinivorans]
MSGPLSGVRVVELAGLGPAPFAAMMLADLGAEVVRVDRPGRQPHRPHTDVLNRNRSHIVLDLKKPEGVTALLDLVDRADVLLEGYRPGVAERLGFGPDVCLDRNPRLIFGRMTGWGQSGPLAHTAGHDIDYIARTGALHAVGRADGPPQIPLNSIGDFGGGGMLLAYGVVTALFERTNSGLGQVVDAAIVDGVAALMAMQYGFIADDYWRDERGVNTLDSGAPYYDVYETSDGRWFAVGAVEAQFYAQLLDALELTGLPDRTDRANWPVIREAFAKRFAERTRDEWTKVFESVDACGAPVLSLLEAPHDPHNIAREVYLDIDGVVQGAPAPRFSRTRPSAVRPAGSPGRDTRAVLEAWGVTDPEKLIASGAAVDDSA